MELGIASLLACTKEAKLCSFDPTKYTDCLVKFSFEVLAVLFPATALPSRAPEPQILDYQTQQYKLFPRLAAAYAYRFAATALHEQFGRVLGEIKKGQLENLAEVSITLKPLLW